MKTNLIKLTWKAMSPFQKGLAIGGVLLGAPLIVAGGAVIGGTAVMAKTKYGTDMSDNVVDGEFREVEPE